MKLGNIGGLTKNLGEMPRKLKKFVTHDVRRNPILGLYLVIGAMAIGYGIYFVGVLYKDFTSGGEKRIASKPKLERVNKVQPSPKPAPVKKKESVPAPVKKSPVHVAPAPAVPPPKKVAKKAKPTTGQDKLEISNWQEFEFKDGSKISFPPGWSRTEIKAEKNIIHGIRLAAPSTKASLKCYGRRRESGADIAKSLKKTMATGGYSRIQEETKEINSLGVVQLSGKLLDKHMIVSIFDDQAAKYFIVSLVASKGDYKELQPYYLAIVDSYQGATKSAVSITTIEDQLEKSIEEDKEFLVGTTIRIKLKSGARHRGVVVAENDNSITLESYRFGGRYSFAVKKEDIAEILR